MALNHPVFHKMPVPSEPTTDRADLTPLSTVDLDGTERHRLPLGIRFSLLAEFFEEQFHLSSNPSSRVMYARACGVCRIKAMRHGIVDRAELPAAMVDAVSADDRPMPHPSEIAWMECAR